MSETFDQLTATSVESQEQAVGLIEKLFTVAQPGAVFGEPVVAEGRTIITAAEVNVGLGVGFGFGGGTAASHPGEEGKKAKHHHRRSADPHERVEIEQAEAAEEVEEAASPSVGEDAGMGGGGGGGGGASGRPIAVISITEDGVEVEPVVDATKIALAFFTTLGSMFFMLAKMRKAAER
jgi:uncharacterized spore protein YtfJ